MPSIFSPAGAMARRCALLLAGASAGSHALANDAAPAVEFAPVTVTAPATRAGLPPGSPGSVTAKSAEQLREQNLLNPEDALAYVPNTTVRKRYPGDRNALLAGRSFGTLQPSRALVYLDGYLISNFLGRFDAPRWNMTSPEALERVDVLQGPYSALLSGHSIGTTVALTQRVPSGFEASGRASAHRQRHAAYGHSDHHDGHQLSLHLGDRLPSGLWYVADVNQQNATSQPMQYAFQTAAGDGTFKPVDGPATAVSGIAYDTDPKGLRRAIFGANAGAIDRTVQRTLNLRAGLRVAPELEVSGMASWWHNDTETRNETFLRDRTGAPVWSGVVTDGVNRFDLKDAAFVPSTRQETHQQLGATLKTRHATGWNGTLVVSDYRILDDTQRQASVPDPEAARGGAGSVTRREGTGWHTLELQGRWDPHESDWTGGRHALTAGLHRNAYRLDNAVASLTGDWRADDGAVSQAYRGRTTMTALYAQDVWRVAEHWRLTLGWREEWFKAHDGSQLGGGKPVLQYSERSLRGHSPKVALAFDATDRLVLKLSAGRGVRFPNVEELYNGTFTATTQVFSDPALKPETSDAIELTAEQTWDQHTLRLSVFHDDVKNAILRQSTTDPQVCRVDRTASKQYTCVQNVDRVKTTGVELAWSARDLGVNGFGVEASAAYTPRSEVTANANDPALVGRWWLRVPRTRATLQTTWRPDDRWLLTASYRRQGRAYNDPSNQDVNPDVYGGVSRVNQLDLRVSCRLTRQVELAVGLNNATDQAAFQSHPYPGRTLLAELRFQQ